MNCIGPIARWKPPEPSGAPSTSPEPSRPTPVTGRSGPPAVDGAVVRLDPADAGERRPAQVACGVVRIAPQRRRAEGTDGGSGDAAAGGGPDDPGRAHRRSG